MRNWKITLRGLCLIGLLLLSACASSPPLNKKPEAVEEAPASPAASDSLGNQPMEEGGIGGTGNSECVEGSVNSESCQQPQP